MILSARHIAKQFGERQILNDISFEVSEGQVCVLMGTNGSGKTTLFNIITGLVEQDQGDVLLDGICVNKLSPHQRCLQGIGRTFQDMRVINDLTVMENVMLAHPRQEGEKWWNALLLGKKVKTEQSKIKENTMKILSKCYIDDVVDAKAGKLSYGQQKLLNLACCIACGTPILLLDEPVAGVNPIIREQLSKVIIQLKSEGKCILVIEHNNDFIDAVADKLLFLHNGNLKHYSNFTAFRHDKNVLNAYL